MGTPWLGENGSSQEMVLTESFYSQIEQTGEGDLVLFRDAVLTYCAALKEKKPFRLSGSPEALELMGWMNIEFEEGEGSGRSFLDPARSPNGDARALASGQSFPITPLNWYREQGYLGTTLFSALVRSSYGPDEPGFFPTQSELGFYFSEDKLLRDGVRWDDEYLEECQLFFFEELTPSELVEHVYARLPREAREHGTPFIEALEGVAFLIGEQTENLGPLTEFFRGLLVSTAEWPGLKAVLQVKEWNEESVAAALSGAETPHWLADCPVEPQQILVACGPDLLRWRAGL